MSDEGHKYNRNNYASSPTNSVEAPTSSHRASRREDRREDSDDDFQTLPALKIEFQTRSRANESTPGQFVSTPSFEDPMQHRLGRSIGRTAPDFSFSPYTIEATDSNVQVGSNIHASMEELHAVEGVSILRTSSQDPHEDSDFDYRFPIHPVDQIARIPARMVPPAPPDHLFATSVVPPAPPDHLFVDNWWNYAPYNFEYIQHDGYPGPSAPSELSTEPRASLRTQTSRGSNEQTDDSSLDKKPPATSVPMKKGRGKGKQTPKKKTKPRKIRTRAHRSSNGSSSSSSPSAASAGAKNAGFSPEPDAEELQEAKTERARQALKNWHERLNDLIRFRLEHGHANVPQKYSEKTELGVWVNKQRMEKKAFDEGKKSSMTPKKIAKLESAGFKWAKPKGVGSWERRYKELQQYINDHGDPHVPTKFKENRALGRWVSTQRNMYKKYSEQGKFNNLAGQEILRRIRLLDSLAFSWNMSASSGSDGAGCHDSGGRDTDDDEEYEPAPFDEV